MGRSSFVSDLYNEKTLFSKQNNLAKKQIKRTYFKTFSINDLRINKIKKGLHL